jgi:methylmalonyl-CoA mutase
MEPGTGQREPAALPKQDDSPLRFVTAASLFDGHDAAINVMRRLIQARGVEVIHLGHNRAVAEVVSAAVQEDADAIAVTSYQGGHNEYFRYMIDMLRERGAAHIRVFGGGGGTITPEEIAALQACGVERIYHPHDGMRLGLAGMIDDVIARATAARRPAVSPPSAVSCDDPGSIAAMLSALEDGQLDAAFLGRVRKQWRVAGSAVPVIGVTGTGGSGKSSVTDELLSRFRQYFPGISVAVLAVDPTRRRTGGALLGDRIRMNSLRGDEVFMRSIATRRQHLSTSAVLGDCIALLKSLAFDLVLVETAGIGQSDSEVVDLVDVPVYVMTSEYGAASQLEKIDMLDFAEMVVINKFDRRGSEDALRDVRKQWRRNHADFSTADDAIPVYPTIASQFADAGVNWLFASLCRLLAERFGRGRLDWAPAIDVSSREPRAGLLIPAERTRYLAEIAAQGRDARLRIERECAAAGRAQHCYEALRELADTGLPIPLEPYPPALADDGHDPTLQRLRRRYNEALQEIGSEARDLLAGWPERLAAITAETYSYPVRDRAVEGDNYRRSLSGLAIPKIAPPRFAGWPDLLLYLSSENLPGSFPYTGGVFPYRRACSPAKARRSAPTGASTTWPAGIRQCVFPPPSTP